VQTATGRLEDRGLATSECQWSMWMHLSVLLTLLVVTAPVAIVAPLVMWLSRRNESAFNDDHGREVLNMSITGACLLALAMLTGIGFLLWIPWAIVAFIGVIRGAVAASKGEYFRYPMTFRFLK